MQFAKFNGFWRTLMWFMSLFIHKFYQFLRIRTSRYRATFISPTLHSVQFSSVTQLCPTLCDSVDHSMPDFPALHYFMSLLFTSGGHSIGASASVSVLPMNIQGWFPLGLTGLISLLSKGCSRVFSNTTVQKHQFFGTQLSSQSNSHIHTRLLGKP